MSDKCYMRDPRKDVFNCPCDADTNGVCNYEGPCEYKAPFDSKQHCIVNENFYWASVGRGGEL
jgi:hypothetical protein